MAALTAGKKFDINWTGGWVGPRVYLDDLEKRKVFCPRGDSNREVSNPCCSGYSNYHLGRYIQGGSNMTGTNCDLFTHKSSRSYLNHLDLNYLVVRRYNTRITVCRDSYFPVLLSFRVPWWKGGCPFTESYCYERPKPDIFNRYQWVKCPIFGWVLETSIRHWKIYCSFMRLNSPQYCWYYLTGSKYGILTLTENYQHNINQSPKVWKHREVPKPRVYQM